MSQWLIRHKWLWVTLVALFAVLALAAACSDDDEDVGETATPTEEPTDGTDAPTDVPTDKVQPGLPLKIGQLNSFTGDLSDFGVVHGNAAQLAVDEINAAGGVGGMDIELVTGDTQTDPTVGTSEATRLVEIEGVDFILGALSSGVTLAVTESVTGPSNVLQISGASSAPSLTVANDNDFLFRTTISDAAQGVVLAQLVSDLGIASVCTMFINNAYGEGLSASFASSFSGLGGTVTAEIPHESAQTTYASELDTCTADGPDALAALAYPESAGIFLREAVEGEVAGTYLWVDGTKSGDMFAELGWPAVFDGTNGTSPSALSLEAGAAFDTRYEAEFGALANLPFVRETYDAVYLMALAAEKSLADDIDIRDALRAIANPDGEAVEPGGEGYAAAIAAIAAGDEINYEGAAGPADFDDNGDVLVGAIETWHVDVANEVLVTDKVFKVDLTTGAVTEVVQ